MLVQRRALVRGGSAGMLAGPSGPGNINMTNSAKQAMSAAKSFATAQALLDSLRTGCDLATVAVLISISLVVTKDST